MKVVGSAFECNEQFMERAIELARLGMGNVAPNPMVGCVIVYDGRIIGEGYHQVYGGAHAEVNAINSVQDLSLLKEATLYVTLEPCAHYGKTPPCADLIVQHRIPRVVIGVEDPFAKVAGKGIEKLIKGGCQVITDCLVHKCKSLNRRFFTFHTQKRPYLILKWAQTSDGFIDVDRSDSQLGTPTWITNELSRIAVHKMRVDEAAILVGTSTALRDNPSLTARDWSGTSPLRIVLDRELRLPKSLTVFDQKTPTIVYTKEIGNSTNNLEFVQVPDWEHVFEFVMTDLYSRNIQSLIIEGGYNLLQSFIQLDLWDEARVYIGQICFGRGVPAPSLPANASKAEDLDQSWMHIYYHSAQ